MINGCLENLGLRFSSSGGSSSSGSSRAQPAGQPVVLARDGRLSVGGASYSFDSSGAERSLQTGTRTAHGSGARLAGVSFPFIKR